jgi:hypothetical protein
MNHQECRPKVNKQCDCSRRVRKVQMEAGSVTVIPPILTANRVLKLGPPYTGDGWSTTAGAPALVSMQPENRNNQGPDVQVLY